MTDQIIEKARQLYADEEYEEAAKQFGLAEAEYRQCGELIRATEMANNRSVALLKARKSEEALQAVEGTAAIFEQAGEIRLQAMALGNEAAALEALGKIDEALTLYTQSADLLKQLGEHELRAYVMKSISALQMKKGKRLESMISMQAALDHQEKLTIRERFLKKLLDLASRMLNRQ